MTHEALNGLLARAEAEIKRWNYRGAEYLATELRIASEETDPQHSFAMQLLAEITRMQENYKDSLELIAKKFALVKEHNQKEIKYERQEQRQEFQLHFKKFYELEKEVQSEEEKKQADKLAYERRETERKKQLAIERTRLEEREKNINELTTLNASLQEANRQKNEVLGIVAHDLKNPLAAILLASSALEQFISRLTPEKILDQISKIKLTAERMNRIIMDLLDIQKLDAGKLELTLQPLDISSLLRSAVNGFQKQAKKKNISLQTAIPNFPLIAHSEQTALEEVLDNLLPNAIKFSPLDKSIFILAEESEQSVIISIKDEGQGITEGDKQKLFGLFGQLSAKPTGGEHSTGLGLSIVKSMVEMMNGKIWCESEVGKGATFIVE